MSNSCLFLQEGQEQEREPLSSTNKQESLRGEDTAGTLRTVLYHFSAGSSLEGFEVCGTQNIMIKAKTKLKPSSIPD